LVYAEQERRLHLGSPGAFSGNFGSLSLRRAIRLAAAANKKALRPTTAKSRCVTASAR
jgi:hypothetical protein